MTYENAVNWLVENVPMKQFDSYQEWYEQCEGEIQTPKLFESLTFNNMLELEAKRKMPNWFRRELPPITRKINNRERTFSSIQHLPTFTTKQAYERNTLRPKPSIRRELQELVKRGRLVRIRRGVYQVV